MTPVCIAPGDGSIASATPPLAGAGQPRRDMIYQEAVSVSAEDIVAARAELERALERWRELTGDVPAATTDSGLPVEPLYGPSADELERIGLPGLYPFTRGIHPSMYRGQLWTMRLYSG